MSHTITITIQNLRNYLDICDSMSKEIEKLYKKVQATKYFKDFDFDNYTNKLNNLKDEINSKIGITIEYGQMQSILTSLSHVEKEVSNIRYLINSKETEIISKIVSENDFNYVEKIANYGTMAYDVLNYMNKNNLVINNENFEDTLKKIRAENVNENEKQKIITYAFNEIDQSELPNQMKYILKKQIREIKTSQEYSDVIPLINSKITNIKKWKWWLKMLIDY